MGGERERQRAIERMGTPRSSRLHQVVAVYRAGSGERKQQENKIPSSPPNITNNTTATYGSFGPTVATVTGGRAAGWDSREPSAGLGLTAPPAPPTKATPCELCDVDGTEDVNQTRSQEA